MDFNAFKNEWLGRRVDFDHVYGFQCVDLILQYIYEGYGINGAYGNAIDFWTDPAASILTQFHKVAGSDAQVGDIVVLNGLPGNPYGHIGLFTGNIDASNIEILEQNGATGGGSGTGGDAIRVRYVGRSRVAGLLRPNAVAPPPAPVDPFTIEGIPVKQVRINKDTHKWGLNYDNFTAINANPEGNASAGEIKTVVAVLHHNIGYNYYLEDAGVASGYNVLDCDDYTPPPPPPPEPVVPPAPPQAPYTAPSSEQYEVTKAIPGFMTSNRAANHISSTNSVEPGNYFVFNKANNMINVTMVQGQPGSWINPDDNVVDPVVPPDVSHWNNPTTAPIPASEEPDWRTSYNAFRDLDGELYTKKYVAMRDLLVVDLEGKGRDLTMHQYNVTFVSGTFVKDGIEYARPTSAAEKGKFYGIPMINPATHEPNLELEATVYDATTTTAEHKVTKTLTFHDYVVLAFAKIESILEKLRLRKKQK